MLQVCSFSMFQRDSGLTKSFEKLDIDKSLLLQRFTNHLRLQVLFYLEIAEKTGLSTSIVVVGGAGDNAAAAVGTGVVEDGKAFTTIGTSGVVFAHSARFQSTLRAEFIHSVVPFRVHGMLWELRRLPDIHWHGILIIWVFLYKDEAKEKGCGVFDLINADVEKTPISANRLIYLPYLNGERTTS